MYSLIPFVWENKDSVLKIFPRKGNGFEGMLKERQFHVVCVSSKRGNEKIKGIGLEIEETPDVIINYTGNFIEVSLDCN